MMRSGQKKFARQVEEGVRREETGVNRINRPLIGLPDSAYSSEVTDIEPMLHVISKTSDNGVS